MGVKELLVLCSLMVLGQCGSIPDYIHICKRSDPQIAQCIQNSIIDLLPNLRKGIPELQVPPVEPLLLDDARLDTNNGNTFMKVNLTDLHVTGGSEFRIIELIPKISKNYFRFKVVHPNIYANGNYQIDAKILVLVLQGQGKFHLNITDFAYDSILKGNVVNENGKKRLVFEKMKTKIGFNKGHIQLENLFNGDPALSKGANDAINDNIDAFFEELRPNFEDALSTRFTDIANKITETFDYDDLFPQ